MAAPEDPEARRYATLPAFLAQTVAELRASLADPNALRHTLARYFKRGGLQGFSTGELIDFLGVSANCLLKRAAYSEHEGDAAMKAVADLSDEEINAEPL